MCKWRYLKCWEGLECQAKDSLKRPIGALGLLHPFVCRASDCPVVRVMFGLFSNYILFWLNILISSSLVLFWNLGVMEGHLVCFPLAAGYFTQSDCNTSFWSVDRLVTFEELLSLQGWKGTSFSVTLKGDFKGLLSVPSLFQGERTAVQVAGSLPRPKSESTGYSELASKD